MYTDALPPEIDEAQYREGKGPCLDAWRQRRILHIPPIDAVKETYPALTAACRDHHVLSTLSTPILSGDDSIGAFNLYARQPEAFRRRAEALACDLAGAAGFVLTNVSAYWTALELRQQLSAAMRSRPSSSRPRACSWRATRTWTPMPRSSC